MLLLRFASLLAVAAGALQLASPAAASSHSSALTCDAQDPASPAPTRSWGVANYDAQPLAVTCPMPTSSYVVTSRTFTVTGWTAPGTTMYCTMWVLRKQDRSLLGVHGLTFPGGARQHNVRLGPNEDGEDSFSELSCVLPAGGKGVLWSLKSDL